MSSPVVSVIIPVYNSSSTIREVLAALDQQDCSRPFEIIIVDDGSVDDTADIVRTFPGVRYFYQDNAGPATARNFGAAQAVAEIFLFTDSDCLPRKDWISRMTGGFTDDRIAVVAGSYGIANPRHVLAAIIHAEIVFRHRRLMPEFPRVFGSYNFAVRRTEFERAGGFNAGYRRASGEDNDLSYKIIAQGGRIRFIGSALVDHYHQTNLFKYLREQFRHGIWRVKMYIDHPKMSAGDNYTFWKDIAEIPVSLLCGLILFYPGPGWSFLVAIILLVLEIVFGVRLMGQFVRGSLAGWVFFLRAYVRTAGFLLGGFVFFRYLFGKVKKSRISLRHL